MSDHQPPAPARPGPAPAAADRVNPVRRYGAALTFGVVGLVVTALLARQVGQWAAERDKERFEAECRRVVGMIEQKMERYETGVGRLRDACSLSGGEVSHATWAGWIDHILQTGSNYPNLHCLLVGPRIRKQDHDAFLQRAAEKLPGYPNRLTTRRPDADEWVPVWRSHRHGGVQVSVQGEDLLSETEEHPSFEPTLGTALGWVSALPYRLEAADGRGRLGFWFAMPLLPPEFEVAIPWEKRGETGAESSRRRHQQRARRATGVLAAFIGGPEFFEQFNPANADTLARVQVYTKTNCHAGSLLNPGHPLPASPRFTQDITMRWYGRRWTARFASTPLFDAQSLRYREALVWGLGVPLSLAGAGALAWQTRSRWREAALAAQLRETLARQERLSRDLHDGTLQSVYGIGLALQRARRFLDRSPVEAAKPLSDTTLGVQRVIDELRAFIREADPATRISIPLGEALEGVVNHLRPATEMEVILGMDPGADAGLDPGRTLQLLNIAREAISNSVRHSHGTRLSIQLHRTPRQIRLVVEDNGMGFDPAAGENLGRGLSNVATRVRELDGTHVWESRPGAGTRLTVEVPMAPKRSPQS